MSANQKASVWVCMILATMAALFAVGYAVAGHWPFVVMFGSLALGLAMAVYGIRHPDMSQVGVAGAGAVGVAVGLGLHFAGVW